jgi:bacteriocin biosynthesis cyclodehydratase domain-containing protein
LNEQFQLLRVSPREYQLVSLFDSLAVKATSETEGWLDRVLPALAEGTDLKTLASGASKKEGRAIRDLVDDFITRGLLDESPRDPVDGTGAAEVARYAVQRRFFANFQAVTEESQDPGATPDDADALQRRLARATVLIAGLGRVGSRVARALAAAGVGTIVGADRRAVTEVDLADSTYVTGELGKPRADALGEQLAAATPFVNYSAPAAPLFEDGLAHLPAGVDMAVLAEDGFDPDHHGALNRACLDAKIPWIGYRSFRTRIEIGPMVIPFETACYHCYELRRLSNSADFAIELDLQQRLAETGSELGRPNVTLGSDVLALEVIKTLTHFATAATYGSVYVMDIVSLESRVHPLLKIPRCPECGVSASKPAANVWRYDAEDETSDN